MKIYFEDDSKISVAKLHYNFKEIENSVLVSFENELYKDTIFSKIDGEWCCDSDLQSRNPTTYMNIKQAIIKHLG